MVAQVPLGRRREVSSDPEDLMDMMEVQPQQWQRDGRELRHLREIWEIESIGLVLNESGGKREESGETLSFLPWGTQEGVEDID